MESQRKYLHWHFIRDASGHLIVGELFSPSAFKVRLESAAKAMIPLQE